MTTKENTCSIAYPHRANLPSSGLELYGYWNRDSNEANVDSLSTLCDGIISYADVALVNDGTSSKPECSFTFISESDSFFGVSVNPYVNTMQLGFLKSTEEEDLWKDKNPFSPEEEVIPSTVTNDSEDEVKPSLEIKCSGRVFWRYGTHHKGPRPKIYEIKIPKTKIFSDSFHYIDPVFDESNNSHIANRGIARIGEGNNIISNPSYLIQLGKQIETLEQAIPSESDPKRRINHHSKLSRLKRRANHEANKIIFCGLDKERELNTAIKYLKEALAGEVSCRSDLYKELKNSVLKTEVAGRKEEYVCETIYANL